MNNTFSFFTKGDPIPEGSHKYVGYRNGKPTIVHDNLRLAGWRMIVARDAKNAATAAGWTPQHDGPVTVEARFYMPRPKRPKFPDHPATKPDLDKLIRAVGDALADYNGVLAEDSRIVTWITSKEWASDDQEPGVHITVTALD